MSLVSVLLLNSVPVTVTRVPIVPVLGDRVIPLTAWAGGAGNARNSRERKINTKDALSSFKLLISTPP